MLLGSIIFNTAQILAAVHDVHLSIADGVHVAFQISRARGLSFDLKIHTILGVHKTGAAAMHSVAFHGAQIDEQAKLVVCVKLCESHAVFSFPICKEPADLSQHVFPIDAVVVNPVGRTVHCSAHFGDVGVEVFF